MYYTIFSLLHVISKMANWPVTLFGIVWLDTVAPIASPLENWILWPRNTAWTNWHCLQSLRYNWLPTMWSGKDPSQILNLLRHCKEVRKFIFNKFNIWLENTKQGVCDYFFTTNFSFILHRYKFRLNWILWFFSITLYGSI